MAKKDKEETKKTSAKRVVVEEVEVKAESPSESESVEEKKSLEESSSEGEEEKEKNSESSDEETKEEETKKEKDSYEEEEKIAVEPNEDEKSSGSEMGDEKKAKMSLKQVLLIAIPTALIVAALTGGILNYLNSDKGNVEEPTPSPSAIETEEPVASPAAELERSDLSVQVLNGSGISGRAGLVRDLLEELGYEDVKTGNADSYDYTETVVSIKDEMSDYEDLIVSDLEDDYTLAEDIEVLDEDSLFDVVIIVGSE